MITMIPISNLETQIIVDFWNRNIGNEFPMTTELFKQNTIKNELVCKQSSRIIVNGNNDVVGVIIAKKNTINNNLQFKEKIGWIQIILVDEKARGQGIGSMLLSHVEENFKKEGIKKIILGKDPYHYFPGIPSNYQQTINWFENKFYEKDGVEHDLIKKYSENKNSKISTMHDVSFSLLDYSEYDEFISFIEREFPGRWAFEVAEYFNNGGKGREFVVAKEKGEIIGFCRINDKYSPVIASNVYWSLLFEEDVGGVGPLGIASKRRGIGYGLLIVEVAIAFIRKRDINTIVIDWTTLVDFYKKLGYIPWKTYHTYSKYI